MRVLVTGGAGFIGSHVVDALVQAGHEVRALDNLATGRRENVREGVKLEEVDIRDADAVANVLADFQPHVVNHQAAQTSVSVSTREPGVDAEVNILGGLNVLQACVAERVSRVVFASTGGAIYGEVEAPKKAALGWTERPLSPYGCAKLAFERYLGFYAHEHGLASTILRYANVYGPRQDPHGEAGVIAIFTERLMRGDPIQINAMHEPGDDGCIRDYVYVDDVVRANVEAVEGRFTATHHVATGVEATTRQVADALISALGSKSEVRFGDRRAGDVFRSVLEPEPRLGETVPLAEGLKRTGEWFLARADKA
jgi:UDP-glucose 4-epimerase